MTRIKQTHKRAELNIQQKLEIIEKFNNGASAQQLADEYGVALPTVQIILKIGNELLTCEAGTSGTSPKRKKRKYDPIILRRAGRGRSLSAKLPQAVVDIVTESDVSEDDFIEPAWLKEFRKQKDESLGESSKGNGTQTETSLLEERDNRNSGIDRKTKDATHKSDETIEEVSIGTTDGANKCGNTLKTNNSSLLGKGKRLSRKPATFSEYEIGDFGSESDVDLKPSIDELKRKKKATRVVLSIDKKLELLDKLENGVSVAALTAEYGVAPNTIRDMVMRKDEYRTFAAAVGDVSGLKQVKPVPFEIVDIRSVGSDDDIQPSSECLQDVEGKFKIKTPKKRPSVEGEDTDSVSYQSSKEDETLLISKKRKATRVRLSIDKKLELLGKLENGVPLPHIINEYGVAPNTIRDMITRKEEYRRIAASGIDISGLKQVRFPFNDRTHQNDNPDTNIYEEEEVHQTSSENVNKKVHQSLIEFEKSKIKTYSDGTPIEKDSDFNPSSEEDEQVVKKTKKKATRVVLSIDKKLELLDKLERGVPVMKLTAEYGVAPNTIRDMVIRKDEYRRFALSVKNVSGMKQVTLPVYNQLTEAMLKWYNEQRRQDKSVYYKDLVNQSRSIIVELRLQKKERVTTSWFEKFVSSFNIIKDGKQEIILPKREQEDLEAKMARRLEFEVSQVRTSEEKKKRKVKYSIGLKKKRKRVELNIENKLKIIEAFENGATTMDLAKEYGIGKQTVKDIVRTSEEYKEFAARPDFNSSLKRVFYNTTRRREGKEPAIKPSLMSFQRSERNQDTEHNYSTLSDSQVNESDDPGNMTDVSCLKRKRIVLSIDKRLEVIDRMDKGDDPDDIAKDHNVSSQTIKDIYARRVELRRFASGLSKNLTKTKSFMSKPLYSELDEHMLAWYKKEQTDGRAVSATDIAIKAKTLFEELNMKGKFRAGRWFKLFVKRHKIQKMKIVKDVNLDEMLQDAEDDSESEGESDLPNENEDDDEDYVPNKLVKKKKRRSRVVLDIDLKLDLLEQIEKGMMTMEEVSNQYGVALGTIRDWLARRGVMQSLAPLSTSTPNGRRSKLTYKDLNKEILAWYKRQPDKEAITDQVLTTEARRIFANLKMGGNFVASPTWLFRFKEQYLNSYQVSESDDEQTEDQTSVDNTEEDSPKVKTAKECLENFAVDLSDSEAPRDSTMEHCSNIHIQYIDEDGKEVFEDIPIFLESNEKETEMEKQKRKRVRLTIEQKLDLIRRLDKGESVTEIAYDYGIAFTTVREIAQRRDYLVQFENCPLMKCRKSAKKNSYCDLDESLLSWCREQEAEGVMLNTSQCLERAKELSVSLGLEGKFKPTQGWLVRFQQRHEIGTFADEDKQLLPSWFFPLEEAMLNWYKEQEALGGDLSEAICIKQAAELFVSLDLRGLFHPTSEWLESFLSRHELAGRVKSDEGAQSITLGVDTFDGSVTFDGDTGNHTDSEIQYVVNTDGQPVTEISLSLTEGAITSNLRKRNLLSLAKKLEMIEQVERGAKIRQVAIDYNIGQQTARDIIQKKSILLALKNGIKLEKPVRKKRKDAGLSKRCVQIQYVNSDGHQVCADIPLPMTKKPESNEKRKRVVLSIEKKMQIIRDVEAGAKIKDVAFENGIGSQTVRDILLKKDQFSQFSPFTNRKTLRGANFVELENAMLEWYQEQEALGLDVSTAAGIKQADYFATTMTLTNFTATKCWYSRFKHRHGLGVWKNESEVSAHRDSLLETSEDPNLEDTNPEVLTDGEMIVDSKEGQLLQLTQDDLYHIENGDNLTFADTDIQYEDEEHYDEVIIEKEPMEEIAIVFEKDNAQSKPDTTKLRRVRLTVEDKLHVIGMVDDGIDVAEIAAAKGVSKQQVKDIVACRSDILEFSLNHTTNRYSMKKSNYEKLDNEMLAWYNHRLAMGLPMSNALCTKQAQELFVTMGLEGSFKTTRWLPRLKQLCEQQAAEEGGSQLDEDEPQEQKVFVSPIQAEESIVSEVGETEANVSEETDVSHGKIASYLDTILHYIENQQDVRISDKRMLKRLFNKTRRKGIAENHTT